MSKRRIGRTLKQNKALFKDASLNMLAFAIYIISQQIILLPLLAKMLDEISYANAIVSISVMNVFCNVLGGQIGVTRQLQRIQYIETQTPEDSDYNILMLVAGVIIAIGMLIILLVLRYDFLSVLLITITTLISNFRLYIRYHFRINSRFSQIILQNSFYLLGISAGMCIVPTFRFVWIPLLLGETLALIYTLAVIPPTRPSLSKTPYFQGTLKRYAGLGSADALTNAVTLIDKLLVYPLLGASSLAVYNAGSATGKATAMIMNPLNEVILVRLSKRTGGNVSKLLNRVILLSLSLAVFVSLIIIPVIFLLSSVLYSQFLPGIKSIIIWLSLACAVSTAASILKSFVIKYAKPLHITICYVLNLVVIATLSSVGALLYGLVGFAVAILIARCQMWMSFVFLLLSHSKKQRRIIDAKNEII